MSDRLITAASGSTDEERIDRAIRPSLLADYVGQQPVREQMGFRPLARNYAQVMGDRPFLLFLGGFVLLMAIEFGRSNFIPVHLASGFPQQTVLGLNLDGVRAMSVLTAAIATQALIRRMSSFCRMDTCARLDASTLSSSSLIPAW